MTVRMATKIFESASVVMVVMTVLLWQSEYYGAVMRWVGGITGLTSLNMLLHMWLEKRHQKREKS